MPVKNADRQESAYSSKKPLPPAVAGSRLLSLILRCASLHLTLLLPTVEEGVERTTFRLPSHQ